MKTKLLLHIIISNQLLNSTIISRIIFTSTMAEIKIYISL